MARKPRIHSPGAFYHVMLRGNGRQDIFFEDQDRYRFYLFLQEGVERFGHRIHAFCLMTNHVHLIIQVDEVPLSRIMQNLSFRYTRWINWRYHRSGHLFQGRYKAVLVDSDSYLLQLVRYVHLNPVRVRVVKTPDEYLWSGHRAYCGSETVPWLFTELTLGMFSKTKKAAVRAYTSFVREGLAEERRGEFHGEGAHDSRILGDEKFVEANLGREGEEVPERISVKDVVTAVCHRYQLEPEMLALPGKRHELSRARGMAAWIAQDLRSCTLKELSEITQRDVSSLSAAAHRLHLRAVTDNSVLREKSEIFVQITRCKA